MIEHFASLKQANKLFEEGKTAQAEAILLRALQRSPADEHLNDSMAQLLLCTGHAARGVYYAERVVKARPTSADALMKLASLLAAAGQHAKSTETVKRALQVEPAHPGAQLTQIQWLYMDYKLHEMMERCHEGLRQHPNHPEFSVNLSNAMLMMGRGDDAVDVLRSSLAANPGDHTLTTALCAAINYSIKASPRDVFLAHAAYGKVLDSMGLQPIDRPRPVLDPEKKLRIGFQSPDLKTHPVAVFLGAFLPHLDRSQFDITAYFTGVAEDRESVRLKPMFDTWRHFTGMREQDMAALIVSDRIDILIELDGHFATHRLPSCYLKPAPVIATYLGYPNTTGVPSIEYRIVDSLTDPPPGAEMLATEQLLRLDPCFLCYQPPADAPDVDPVPPSQRPGGTGITFGSFNSLQKINPRLIGVWKRVMDAVPNSRLLIKTNALRHQELRDSLGERFQAGGFPMDRLELMIPTFTAAEHLAVYNKMDIALDAFPYCGTTTTCESLLMGVPVVSLASPPQPEGMHAGRVGLSLLTAAGVPELVAHTEDQYVALAASLASQPQRLAEFRGTMRGRLLASPLCDAATYGARFGDALRGVWREFCRAGKS